MIPIPTNIPWGLIAGAVAVIALFGFGWFMRGSKEEQDRLKRKLEYKRLIDEARGKVLVLDRKGQKTLRRLRDAKKTSHSEFANFANKLLRKIFRTGKD